MPLIYARRIRGWRFILLNLVIGLANVVVLSNVPGYTILGPYAAADLGGVTPSFGTWATTDHMIGIALGFPIARVLVARFGDYRVYVAALTLYAVISFVCANAESIYFFVPVRLALGLVGGVILPVGQGLLLGEYPEKRRVLGVGIWGVLSMMPFTIGVFMGGWYNENLGWRSLFWSNVPVALLVAAVVGALFHGRGFQQRIARFDMVGYVLLAVVLLSAQTIFNQGNDFDWLASPFLVAALIAFVFALPCFVIWELAERHPAMDLRLFAYRNYAVAVICSVVGFFVIQGLLSLFIVQLQLLLGYTSSLAGLVYISMIFLSVPLVAVVHVLSRNTDPRAIACWTFLGFAVTLTWLGLYDKSGYFDQIALPMIFFGVFLAAFFTPLAALAIQGLPAKSLGRAGEELTLLRTAAGAFGIALQGVVLFRRTPFHQLDLADHFGGRRFASLDLYSQFMNRLQAEGMSMNAARSQTARFIKQQAGLLALNDAFLLGAAVFVLLAGFVFLARPVTPPPARAVEKLQQAEAEEMMEQG
jgi:DHA2 family multidrug resistance protein